MATYKITNPKGEVKSNLTREQVKEFKMALARRNPPILDPKAAGYTVEEESESIVEEPGNKTTYEERKEYFGGGASGALAEAFPSLAEQYMFGNKEFNLGNLRAGFSDVLSLPGRTLPSLANKSNLVGGSGEFNLGARSGEGTNLIGSILRDPITSATIPVGGYLAKGVGTVADIGAKVLKNAGRYGENVGRAAGSMVAGGAEGAGIEAASSLLNRGELPSAKDVAIGAGLGAGFETVGNVVQQLMQRYGRDLVDASVAALLKGNVKAHVTPEEKAAFLADPKNHDALQQVLKQQTSGRNAFPVVGGSDRGKTLQGNVDKSFKEIEGTIKKEPMLNDGDFAEEIYQNKTIYKPGERNVEDLNYQHEIPESRNFRSKKSITKDYKYQSKAEYDLEKFADKYAGVSEAFNSGAINDGPITADELKFLDMMKSEIRKDGRVLKGYDPDYVLSSNKFFGDRLPFSDAKLSARIDKMQKEHGPSGFSREFIDEVRRLGNEATEGIGQKTADKINKAYDGEWNKLERAFAYTDPKKSPPILVRKGLRDALDRFADTLDEQALKSVGDWRKNSKGELYFVTKEKAKKYNYQYLAHLQETLGNVKNNKHLTAESIAGLYSDATMRNDNVVKDAIIKLLEDMGLSEQSVNAFKAKAGNYSMFHKAREAMKKPVKDDTFKGTVANVVVPQEGFNFRNSLGFNLQGRNVLNGTNDGTKLGSLSRYGYYNLGRPFFKGNNE